jgi:hypothetical protein
LVERTLDIESEQSRMIANWPGLSLTRRQTLSASCELGSAAYHWERNILFDPSNVSARRPFVETMTGLARALGIVIDDGFLSVLNTPRPAKDLEAFTNGVRATFLHSLEARSQPEADMFTICGSELWMNRWVYSVLSAPDDSNFKRVTDSSAALVQREMMKINLVAGGDGVKNLWTNLQSRSFAQRTTWETMDRELPELARRLRQQVLTMAASIGQRP